MFHRTINILKSQSFFLFGARGTGKTTSILGMFPESEAHRLDLLETAVFGELEAYPERLSGIIARASKPWVIIDEQND